MRTKSCYHGTSRELFLTTTIPENELDNIVNPELIIQMVRQQLAEKIVDMLMAKIGPALENSLSNLEVK